MAPPCLGLPHHEYHPAPRVAPRRKVIENQYSVEAVQALKVVEEAVKSRSEQ